jgi:hypothetical protein
MTNKKINAMLFLLYYLLLVGLSLCADHMILQNQIEKYQEKGISL